MHARTTPAVVATALLAVLAFVGCDGDRSSGSAPPVKQSTTAGPTSDDATSEVPMAGAIPDGRYARVATEADFDATALSEELKAEFLGSDAEMLTAFEFDGDRWTHYITNDAGVEEVGDLGTLTYDDRGRLVTTSESTGCPGCVGFTVWELNGDVLELRLDGDDVDPVDAFVIDGEYTHEG
jgi:hypothetical protein